MQLTHKLSITTGRTVTFIHPRSGHTVTGRIETGYIEGSAAALKKNHPIESAAFAVVWVFGDDHHMDHRIDVPAVLVADITGMGPLMDLNGANAEFRFLLNEMRAVDGGEGIDADLPEIIRRLNRLANHLAAGGLMPDANAIINEASRIPVQA